MGGINCRRITVGRNSSENQTEELRLRYANFLGSLFQYNSAFNLGNSNIEKVMVYEKSNKVEAAHALEDSMEKFKESLNFIDNSILQLKSLIFNLKSVNVKKDIDSKKKSSNVLSILNAMFTELENQEDNVSILIDNYRELDSSEFIQNADLNEVIRDSQITDLTEAIFLSMSKTLKLVYEFSTLIKVEDRALVINTVNA